MKPPKYCIEVRKREEADAYSCVYEHIADHAWRMRHQRQTNTRQIARMPKRSARSAFHARDPGAHELFADDRIKALAEQHQLQGMIFLSVLLGSKQESQEIFRLTSPRLWQKDIVVRGHGERSELR